MPSGGSYCGGLVGLGGVLPGGVVEGELVEGGLLPGMLLDGEVPDGGVLLDGAPSCRCRRRSFCCEII